MKLTWGAGNVTKIKIISLEKLFEVKLLYIIDDKNYNFYDI